jgi:hypothetical protein
VGDQIRNSKQIENTISVIVCYKVKLHFSLFLSQEKDNLESIKGLTYVSLTRLSLGNVVRKDKLISACIPVLSVSTLCLSVLHPFQVGPSFPS